LKTLDAIQEGVVEGLSPEEIRTRYKLEYEAHHIDPYGHRYPRGESYHDLALRLEPVILELERANYNVLVIADETVLRCLYAYVVDRSEKDIPNLTIPEMQLIELTPHVYTVYETHYSVHPSIHIESPS
jgi:6-phosphofructo-2-kinase/fructose-2,6-biphosphatase 4